MELMATPDRWRLTMENLIAFAHFPIESVRPLIRLFEQARSFIRERILGIQILRVTAQN